MDGVEFLNLRTYVDLKRLVADLKRQARRLPAEEALMAFRLCRPEIVDFVDRMDEYKYRATQLVLDMHMSELLLEAEEPGTRMANLEECRQVLGDCLQFLQDLVKRADDYNLWEQIGICCHRQIICCLELDYPAQAETCCDLFLHSCRKISQLLGGKIIHSTHRRLLQDMYLDTEKVFALSPDPDERLRGCLARMQHTRIEMLMLRNMVEEREREMVKSYQQTARDLIERPTPQTLKQALDYCGKGLRIVRKNLKRAGMRSKQTEYWITMGYIWEQFGSEEAFLKAKDCYVHAADSAKIYLCYCIRTDNEIYDARSSLQRCYIYIAEMCEKLPGEKYARKAAKYRALAEDLD